MLLPSDILTRGAVLMLLLVRVFSASGSSDCAEVIEIIRGGKDEIINNTLRYRKYIK